jgi:mono/diheme cytochrome c family protein
MRHFLANIMTYAIAAALFAGAAAFAWMRSAQLALTNERTVIARFEPAPAGEFRWDELGRISYERNCANCHGGDGRGWDEYPPLQQVAELAAGPGGREFIVDLHLYGLTSNRWGAPMPPMGHIHDVELAAVMNWVLTHYGRAGTDQLYVPQDVAARRGLGLSPRDVNRTRPARDDAAGR